MQRAYSLWIRSAREKENTAKALGDALGAYLRKAYRLGPEADLRKLGAAELTGRTITRWEKGVKETPQPQLPQDPWSLEALVAVVTALVPTPPVEMEWTSFQDVCERFAAEKQANIERGAGNLESHAAQKRNEERHRFLDTWPAPASEIDPIAIGLGSWAFNGALPPYVPRTVDGELAKRLKTRGITTVTGAPKSGKSRSILETLQRHHPDALTWWVNPSPTVLPDVVELAKKAKGNERPQFVVLDDAGLIGPDPRNGLSAQRLVELANACTHLIVVIHNQTLATWENQLTNRTTGDFVRAGNGANKEFIDMLSCRIRYESVLDDVETAPAAMTYENCDKRVKGFDLSRLAETLAGVETFKRQANELLETPASVDAALLEAAIDASIAFPSGTAPDILGMLAKIHYRRRQPNRPWDENLLKEAFFSLTTGITAESPHAILVTTNHETYRLLDALTPEFQHLERDIDGVLEALEAEIPVSNFATACYDTGNWYYENGKTESAWTCWNRAAESGNLWAMNRLGIHAFFDCRDPDTARHWFGLGAEGGDQQAMVNFGSFLDRTGELESACVWWERAVDKFGDSSAMLCLGNAARKKGHLQKAEFWWKKAFKAGNADGMTALGNSCYRAGKHAEARICWERAARAGAHSGMVELGVAARDAGDLETAKKWWTLAADGGNAGALFHLGSLAYNAGDLEASRSLWKQAAAGGHTKAMLIMGALCHEGGDLAGADEWWKRAADNGDVDAKAQLGQSAQQRGDLKEAAFWWELAAKSGHAAAKRNLGILTRNVRNACSCANSGTCQSTP